MEGLEALKISQKYFYPNIFLFCPPGSAFHPFLHRQPIAITHFCPILLIQTSLMKRLLLVGISAILFGKSESQFRFDNSLYKTIYLEDLCQQLNAQKDRLLLDVRSKGEFNDTSTFQGLNMGHLKGAVNIDIMNLAERINELDGYQNKTIYVYCSHSQRSRRASRLLSEKGFKNIINVNGGMSVLANLSSEGKIPCQQEIYETHIRYHLLSPVEFNRQMQGNQNSFILDVRKDSAYQGISSLEMHNAYGRLINSVNIPKADLEASLSRIPKGRKILVVDEQGNESPAAAELLISKGYPDVSILFDGLENWVSADPLSFPREKQWETSNHSYGLLGAEEFNRLVQTGAEILILDIREDSLYNNQAKMTWRNIGQIKNSINIPASRLLGSGDQIARFKDKPVIVYGFSSTPDIFSSAKWLHDSGYAKVYVLLGGLFNLRWSAANLKGHEDLGKLVIHVPDYNL
jgi:rhodanese-related sulfurtransferase